MQNRASVAARGAQQTEEREDFFEAAHDSDSIYEAVRRQEQAAPPERKGIQYPTWRYCSDGRAQIVSDPFELEQLEATGGEWADKPFPAETEFIPNGFRTFAGPVGTVDARGAAARIDRPGPEVALTTALPRNVQGSVPSSQAETRQRQAVVGSTGRTDADPSQAVIARLEARISELERQLGDSKVAQNKARHTDPKTGVDKRQAGAKQAQADARETAKRHAEADQKAEAEAKADAASDAVAAEAGEKAAEKPKGSSKKKK